MRDDNKRTLSSSLRRRVVGMRRALLAPLMILSSMADSLSFTIARTGDEVRAAAAATIMDYAAVARGYAEGNMNHDVSQNIDAMLEPLRASPSRLASPFDVLDVCCASGRDLLALKNLGHNPVGLDGVAEFCEMSREVSGCEVWEQSLADLDLPAGRFDAIFLQRVPLPRAFRRAVRDAARALRGPATGRDPLRLERARLRGGPRGVDDGADPGDALVRLLAQREDVGGDLSGGHGHESLEILLPSAGQAAQ